MKSWSTHPLDLAYKLTVEACSLAGALGGLWLAYQWNRSAFYLLSPTILSLTALGMLGLYVVLRALLVRTLLPAWAPTYLYVNLSLRTRVSPREAGVLAFLFDGSLDGSWYPLTSVKRLPAKSRRAALFRYARELAASEHPSPAQTEAPVWRFEPAAPPPPPPEPPDPQAEQLHELGLSRRPSDLAQLRRAYRRRIARYHPDRFALESAEARAYAEEVCKRINRAYADLAKSYPA